MIEQANFNDIDEIMQMIDIIKEELLSENNKQWGSTIENYPNKHQFRDDITKKGLFIYKENNKIIGVISATLDNDYYKDLLDTSKKKAYILHRLAVPKEYRNKNIAKTLLNYVEELAKSNHIEVLKGDTEIKNTKMNNLFIKSGYKKIGEFEYDDYPGHYICYEKEVGSE